MNKTDYKNKGYVVQMKNENEIIYRRAGREEINILADIRKKQLIDEGAEPNKQIGRPLNEFFEKYMKDDSMIEWIAEINHQIVGTSAIIFYEFPPSFSNPSGIQGYIANMYTAPEYRGMGIARALINHLVEEAKKRNVAELWLIASDMGKPVYSKYGFREAKDRMVMEIEE